MADHAGASQSPHGTEKALRVTDHVRLYVLFKLLGYELYRPYGPKPIMVAEVPFNHGQCVVDIGVRLEGSQALCNIGDSNPAPQVEEVVGVLVFCPVPKGKCLEHGKGAWTAYRNFPGSPCTGRNAAGQFFPAPVFECQFETWRDYRG